MRKLLFTFLLLFSYTFAADIEILSGKIDINGTIITASEDVVVLYDDMLISAKKMRYDRKRKLLDLEGDIHILKGTQYYAIGVKMHMDVNAKHSNLSPLFLHEKNNDLWFSTKKAEVNDGVYELNDAIVSSCNPVKPAWRMGYSDGKYDSNEKWVDLYNMVIYVGEIPIVYLPYFGFSTDDTRTSGFMRPSIGWSDSEGFFFDQPVYFVGSDRWDIELRYQSRSLRGEGLFSTLRFVDSPSSQGNIELGFFKELNDNAKDFGWSNELHKGIEVDYARTHLIDSLFDDTTKDKLFIDINVYNDIDYLNLKLEDDIVPETSNFITSKINYVLGGDNHYLGIYSKYFLDTNSTGSNDNYDTLQELPQIQYHKYKTSFLLDTLTYSIDYNMIYRTRPDLSNAVESLITIPVNYTLPLFNEYLTVAIEENIALSNMTFANVNDLNQTLFQDGDYVSSSQKFSIYTDLTKKYSENIHTMNFGLEYQVPGDSYKSGFYTNSNGEFDDTDCKVGEACEFAQGSIDPVERRLDAQFTQFIYDGDGEEFIYHKMTQSLSVDNNYSVGVLENEIRLKFFDDVILYNNTYYQMEEKHLQKSLSSISYNSNYFKSHLTHLYVDQPELEKYSNYYTLNAALGPWNNYQYVAQVTYNDITKISDNWKVGIKMQKRCWSYELSYTQRVIPSSTSSVNDKFIFIRVSLIPIAGLDNTFDVGGS